jgi:hypothetical protein
MASDVQNGSQNSKKHKFGMEQWWIHPKWRINVKFWEKKVYQKFQDGGGNWKVADQKQNFLFAFIWCKQDTNFEKKKITKNFKMAAGIEQLFQPPS